MGVFGSQLIPWHVYLAYYVGISVGVYPLVELVPLDFLRYNFLAYIAVISPTYLTFTGLDRFIPMFKLPQEPDVRIKKKTSRRVKLTEKVINLILKPPSSQGGGFDMPSNL